MASSQVPNDVHTLSQVFNEGLDKYNAINNTNEPTNTPSVQIEVKEAMRSFEQATRLVSLADIFSRNEGIEEVTTTDLQYFLLPALLGSLTLKITSGDRKHLIEVAEIYFRDFIQRCNDYGLSNHPLQGATQADSVDLANRSEFDQISASVSTRANKIQRYKEQKELKAKLVTLKQNMDNEHCDEDIKRDYFITMIKSFIHDSIDELNSIETEKPILDHIATLKQNQDEQSRKKGPPPRNPPLKPIIITRDEIQKAVYGAGYPSLPTMTVQEFYDKRVADGVFPDPNKRDDGSRELSMQEASLAGISLRDEDKEDAQTEKAVEEDDEEYIERMRQMDEYKDEHRRGWGNRMNRS